MNKIIVPGQKPTTQPGKNDQMSQLVEYLKHSTGVKCENEGCESSNFIEVVRIRKVSGLITGLGREMLIPVPVYACADCGHINEMFMKSSGLDQSEAGSETEDEQNTDDKKTDSESSPLIIPGK